MRTVTDIHAQCVEAVRAMIANGVLRHVSYVTSEDLPQLFADPDLVYRVEIRFAEEGETIDKEV